MPDERTGIHAAPVGGGWARLAAWWRRGRDADLLTLLPAVDENGNPLACDFPHPVNRSPLWRLLRPWLGIPALLLVGTPLVLSVATRGAVVLSPGELAFFGVIAGIGGASIRRRRLPRVQRQSLRIYRQYRWRATTVLDATIRDALDRERTPKRLLDGPAAHPPR